MTRVHAAAWQVGYAHMFEAGLLQSAIRDRAKKWIDLLAHEDPTSLLLVGALDEEVVSLAHAGPSQEHEGAAEIYSFYVHPSHWGTGAAQEMMSNVLRILQVRGFAHVYLSTYGEALRGRRFFEAAGFTETGHTTQSLFQGGVIVGNVEYVADLHAARDPVQ